MSDPDWLILRLEAPLMAFGGVAIDQVGVTRDFPAASMLVGLFGNALGWRRTDAAAHQALQDRLIFAARRDRPNHADILTDMQNATLTKDRGWTTRGVPEERAGASYDAPHRRRRDYHADSCITVALRLVPAEDAPDLHALAAALDRPARPLFLGRKPCLPSGMIRGNVVAAGDAHAALSAVPPVDGGLSADPPGDAAVWGLAAQWPLHEGPSDGPQVDAIRDLADLRNWRTGLHGGVRPVVQGRVRPAVESLP